MGWYASTEGAIRDKGTMYFVLHPHGLNMAGRWVGLSNDGKVITGWGSMAKEVVITAPDPDWLLGLTRELVTEGLCASVHNFSPVKSIYRWRGKIFERTEGRASLRLINQPPQPVAPDNRSGGSVADELRKLSELRDAGVLTNAEFNAQKARLLGS